MSKKFLKDVKPIIKKINLLAFKYREFSQEQMIDQMKKYKLQVKSREKSLEEILPDVFAITKEACLRSKGMKYFDVQLIGAIAIHRGKIAEMKTGEGKTLVASLPAILNTLEGKGVRVVTFNDYLTHRDWKYCKPIFDYLNLTSAFVIDSSSHEDKKYAYSQDITYCSKDQLVFDYLRHNMRVDSYGAYFPLIDGEYHHYYAIIDEVDAVLIDNARTPLIISGFGGTSTELYKTINPLIANLQAEDYHLGQNKRVVFTETGAIKLENSLQNLGIIKGNLYNEENLEALHVTINLLKAHKAFTKNIDYVISEFEPREAIIIGDMTGREEQGRRFSDGLHQAIEAKEGLEVRDETVTKASMTYPNYFRMYKKLAGMTGTAIPDKDEFEEIYNLQIIEIPTNRPVIRIDHKHAYVYKKILHMYEDVIELIRDKHQKKQPVLACTTSIEESELLATLLENFSGIKARVLNARTHKQEADIIAQAGRPGIVTISTVMAGRGTDVLLGGNEEVALETLGKNVSNYEEAKAKLIEQYRKDRELVKELGGLVVIVVGTPESEKSVIQFRGRAGRQGDAGESFFFTSLEDSSLRLLLEEKINSFLIEHIYYGTESRFVRSAGANEIIKYFHTGSLTHSFEARKNVLKYDDVINEQRINVYEFRDYLIDSSAGHKVVKVLLAKNPEIKKIVENIDAQSLQSLVLYCFDKVWYEHVIKMENLKKTIHIASYEQKEPTQEYKRLAYEMFKKALVEFKNIFIKECQIDNPFDKVTNLEDQYGVELEKLTKLFEEMKDTLSLEDIEDIKNQLPKGMFSKLFASLSEEDEHELNNDQNSNINIKREKILENQDDKTNINPNYAKTLLSDQLKTEMELDVEDQLVHLGIPNIHYSYPDHSHEELNTKEDIENKDDNLKKQSNDKIKSTLSEETKKNPASKKKPISVKKMKDENPSAEEPPKPPKPKK